MLVDHEIFVNIFCHSLALSTINIVEIAEKGSMRKKQDNQIPTTTCQPPQILPSSVTIYGISRSDIMPKPRKALVSLEATCSGQVFLATVL
jgi:hypothetical protein